MNCSGQGGMEKLPLRFCDACIHKKFPDGGWCYIFKQEPSSAYCAQFKINKSSPFAAKGTTP